jgi:hypothetical protein
MFTTLLTNQLPDDSLLCSSLLDSLASENLFIQRKSAKSSASGFVYSLLNSVIDGNSSLSDIGLNLGNYQNSTISKQAIHQRLNQHGVDFMKSVNAELLKKKFTHSFPLHSSNFQRILIEDASLVKMHNANSENFRGYGNRDGSTAAFKVDFCYDLLTGDVVSSELVEAYNNDKKAGAKLIDQHVKAGDLVIRDMGYYSQLKFIEIENKGAYWSSKVPTNVNIFHEGKDLNDLLRNTLSDTLDIEVTIGSKDFKTRLIACRATPQQASEKRRRANQQARNHGKTPRKSASLRNGWHISVTNVSKHQMSTKELVDVYRLRWQIETVFKAWKQSVNMKKCFNKKSNIYHHQCLIQASLLLLILTMRFVTKLQAKHSEWISVRKVAKTLGMYIKRLNELDELRHFAPDARQVLMEKRSRINLMELAKNTLT